MTINLFRLFFAAIYYPGGCDAAVPDHVCDPCEPIEPGRVRSIAFIRKDFTFDDPENPAEWRAGIEDRAIIIIPEVRGSYNGGDPQEGTGYGDNATRLTGYNHELTVVDPNYGSNGPFYNAIKNSRNYRVAWRTGTKSHISDSPVAVFPSNPVEDDLNGEVTWNLAVRFSQPDLSEPFETPAGIFDCFAVQPA